MGEVVITLIGGNCPVQAEGTIAGEPFYFRARGQRWSIEIGGGFVLGGEGFYYEEPYGDGPFDAGWMPVDEARGFIAKAAAIFSAADLSDGQPDEAQEWADYDPDC